MRRYAPPFNGKRYLLNRNTGEIHDLDNETEYCHIDDTKPEHIWTEDSYMSCLIAAAMLCPYNQANGCYYCLKIARAHV